MLSPPFLQLLRFVRVNISVGIFLDALLGILGAILVAKWSLGLMKETGKTLLDAEMDHPVVEEIREVIAEFPKNIEITDIHVWKVAKGKFSCILALETDDISLTADQIRHALSIHDEIVHISVEINTQNLFMFHVKHWHK